MKQRNRLQQTIRAASMRPESLPKWDEEHHLENTPEGKLQSDWKRFTRFHADCEETRKDQGCPSLKALQTPRRQSLHWGFTAGDILNAKDRATGQRKEEVQRLRVRPKGGRPQKVWPGLFRGLSALPGGQTAASSCAAPGTTRRHDGEGWREWIWPYWEADHQDCF